MCYDCWIEADFPRIDTPQVRECAAIVKKIYQDFPTGGFLHCALDDYNLDDEAFAPDSYEVKLIEENGLNATKEQLQLFRECVVKMRALTEPERYSAVALAVGFWQ